MVTDILPQEQEQRQQQQQQQQPKPSVSRNESLQLKEQHRSIPLKTIGNYSLQQSIGKGSMGKVKLGVHNVTGEKVPILFFYLDLASN